VNPVLAEFLDLLGRQPDIAVLSSREAGGVVRAGLSARGERATLVANAALPPVTRTREGKRYGAYSIVQDGHPDWIKGDDPTECVAHVLSWFDGLESRTPGPVRLADLSRLTDGEGERPGVEAVMAEMVERSAMRVTGAGQLTSLDGRHLVCVEADGAAIRVLDGGASFSVTARTIGICAAAVLGFTDGLSRDSDG
jgi:hypothetical protein